MDLDEIVNDRLAGVDLSLWLRLLLLAVAVLTAGSAGLLLL